MAWGLQCLGCRPAPSTGGGGRLGAAASLEDGLGALPELEVLELRRCPRVAGSGLAALSGHRSLRRVAMRECGGANAGGLLRGLTPLHQLQVRDRHRPRPAVPRQGASTGSEGGAGRC